MKGKDGGEREMDKWGEDWLAELTDGIVEV